MGSSRPWGAEGGGCWALGWGPMVGSLGQLAPSRMKLGLGSGGVSCGAGPVRAGGLGDVAGWWKGTGAGLGAVGRCPRPAAPGRPGLGLATRPSSAGHWCLLAAGLWALLAQGSLEPCRSPCGKLKQVDFLQNTFYLEMKMKLKKKTPNNKTDQLQHQ